MEEYEEGGSPEETYVGATYVGLASKDPERDDEEKVKLTIEGALRHAYEVAREQGSDAEWFTVVETQIRGDNPISDYRVVIRP